MRSKKAEAIEVLFDSFVARMSEKPDMELDELRDLIEECGDLARDPGGVDYLDVDVDGTPSLWLVPHGCSDDHVLLCFHGGGCVTGTRFSHRKMFAHIAKAVGCRALVIDYARAPEHTHPSQINEGLKAYKWLLQQGIDASSIATVGDSAGGNLCTAVVLHARDSGVELPAAVIPLSPWYDMEATGKSFESNAAVERLITREVSLSMSQMYIGDCSPRDPLVNPIHADFKNFPPTYIQVGGYEAILDDSLRVAKKLEESGVEYRCDVFPEMQHVFQFMAGNAPEADEAISRLADWVRPKLGLA